MAIIEFTVNAEARSVDVDSETPLLWVLRDTLGLLGTKHSCGAGLCGCCSVLVDGVVASSCSVPMSTVAGKTVTTIEGLSSALGQALQQAWLDEGVAQCGFCQPGMLIAAAGLLEANPSPSDAEIDAAMAWSLCRCGTYQRIRAAIKRAAGEV